MPCCLQFYTALHLPHTGADRLAGMRMGEEVHVGGDLLRLGRGILGTGHLWVEKS